MQPSVLGRRTLQGPGCSWAPHFLGKLSESTGTQGSGRHHLNPKLAVTRLPGPQHLHPREHPSPPALRPLPQK